ncbi:hypothetical protein FLK61_24780 [Paenalkalicoccus suaedae]|uniref:ABC transporter permease n=1 Tax=Paenalkalicoccus suaedae TaxID=2592382 RepID=A0A859F9W4_9BACI|nr:hypothetical protein [Paenalkalicoccus suaedae]QKS69993.1 hypothetical protein FLK61_24780 [Paenalkalicoccus suaedae]
MVWYELTKLLRTRALFVMLTVFLGFNAYFIISHSYLQEEVQAANDMVDWYGPTFTDESLEQMETDLMEEVQSISPGEEALADFFEDGRDRSIYDAEQDRRLNITYTYLLFAKHGVEAFKGYDPEVLKGQVSENYQLGSMGSSIEQVNINRATERYHEIMATEEHKAWYFLEGSSINTLLFKDLFTFVCMQLIILSVYTVALIVGYERDAKTELTILATKQGRPLLYKKLLAAFIGVSALIFTILGMTLLVYFTVFNYANVWQAPLTNVFTLRMDGPAIHWFSMSFLEYLLYVIVLVFLSSYVIAGATFAATIWIPQTYVAAVAVLVLFLNLIALPFIGVFPGEVMFLSMFNPMYVLFNLGAITEVSSSPMGLREFVFITLGIWLTISMLVVWRSSRFYMIKDVKA